MKIITTTDQNTVATTVDMVSPPAKSPDTENPNDQQYYAHFPFFLHTYRAS